MNTRGVTRPALLACGLALSAVVAFGTQELRSVTDTVVTAASSILSQSVKGGVADDLLAKGIAEVREKLN